MCTAGIRDDGTARSAEISEYMRTHACTHMTCYRICVTHVHFIFCAYACLVYWFVLVQHTELHATRVDVFVDKAWSRSGALSANSVRGRLWFDAVDQDLSDSR